MAGDAAGVVAENAPDAPDEESDAATLERLGLKDPDELKAGDDFKPYLDNALPTRLRNRALRKLWASKSVLANLDELVDYGEDFTDAATVIENMQTAYQVGRGYLRDEPMKPTESEAEMSEAEMSEAEVKGEAREEPEGEYVGEQVAPPSESDALADAKSDTDEAVLEIESDASGRIAEAESTGSVAAATAARAVPPRKRRGMSFSFDTS